MCNECGVLEDGFIILLFLHSYRRLFEEWQNRQEKTAKNPMRTESRNFDCRHCIAVLRLIF